jgi:hypothetical protein
VCALRRLQLLPSRYILTVRIAAQKMLLFEKAHTNQPGCGLFPRFVRRKEFTISTSAYGIGQVRDSNQTPLGLHRVARKVGAGQPIGTVFRSREAVGLTWNGHPNGSIVHRIFWLDGLEAGLNRGGNVDTFSRYIYIHGFGDELTLGRPASQGCVHVAARDLIPLFERIPTGTLVWIGER